MVTSNHRLFVKWRAGAKASFFEAEVDGLMRLKGTDTLRVPEVLGVHAAPYGAALALGWISQGRGSARAMEDAGRGLAHLHRQRGKAPGYERDNYIGALSQPNHAEPDESWQSFFTRQRIAALASALSPHVRRKLERFDFSRFVLEPTGGCSLLHGDLWSGNVVVSETDDAWFVDPAVYRGHPEVDLAMTRLFGGFSSHFYDAYQEVAGSLDREWTARAEVLNLYPLLVHTHLFGAAYEAQVEATLDRFGGSRR